MNTVKDQRNGTWLDAEELAYPSGSLYAGRRAYAELSPNPHNPVVLAYGARRIVRVGIPDTYFSIPARLRTSGRTIAGFVSVDTTREVYTFTPEAAPESCLQCAPGQGCRK